LVADILKSRGLRVIEARSAKAADAILRLGDPALAIVDYRLPQVDGLSWTRSIREAGRKFPIVFLSGAPCDGAVLNLLRNILKVSLILLKPIAPELFVRQIESLLPAHLLQAAADRTKFPVANAAEKAFQSIVEEGGEKTARQGHSSTTLSNLQLFWSEKESQDRLSSVRADYAIELTRSWQELSRIVSSIDQDPVLKRNDAVCLAHKIRGTAGSIGFSRLGKAAGKIEDLLVGMETTGTLQDAEWTEVFDAVANGESCIRESIQLLKAPSKQLAGAGSIAYALS
jgi:DNA-binding response OmpR family regulator